MAADSSLPTGTVTFMFTDVEGSTRLLQELGPDDFAAVLADHRRIVREAIAANGGAEVDTQGDAFFAAFPTAPAAIETAGAIRAGLAAGPIRLRIGIHTGTPLVTDEGYVGDDVHRAARIAAAGHGGQVLVSQATATLLEVDLRDLGDHRLKDLASPERIFQLDREDFPPLRSLFQSNLPIPPTPFLGRDGELADLAALLDRPEVRLLTLTGPGGTGKTRLSIQAAGLDAARYPDGTWWVPLAAIRDARLVLAAASEILGARGDLTEHIGERRMLLVFDNFEQVAEASAELASLLARCRGLRVLVTSRERLAVPGEHVYAVPPMAPPEGAELFVARARMIEPRFEPDDTVQVLCDRLDNLPLALELAASRIGSLSLAQLHDHLSRRLDLAGGRGLDARQRTIRAAIEWSHDLLSADEQAAFARLAVFRGGFTLDAAESVTDTDADMVGSLVDKSLVRRADERHSMLETIAEFAAERLEASDESERIRRRHAEWFLDLAESANLSMESLGRGPQRHGLLAGEGDNLRAAMDWAATADVGLGLRLAIALENWWVIHDAAEGMRRLGELLDRAADVDPHLRARALRDLGGCSEMAGDIERAVEAYEQGRGLFQSLGDEQGAWTMVFRLGVSALRAGDVEKGRRLHEESLVGFREIGDPIGELQAMGNLGSLEIEEGDIEKGIQMTTASLARAREIGWTWWESFGLIILGEAAMRLGRLLEADAYGRESLVISRRIEDRDEVALGLMFLAWVAAAEGDSDRAGLLWRSVEAEHRRSRLRRWEEMHLQWAPNVGPIDPEGPVIAVDEAVDLALAGSNVGP
jgi:predicted ATPase/class 3 adenylate cyclase